MSLDVSYEDLLELESEACFAVAYGSSSNTFRICNGLFLTDEEYEAVREEVLNTPLP